MRDLYIFFHAGVLLLNIYSAVKFYNEESGCAGKQLSSYNFRTRTKQCEPDVSATKGMLML